MFKPKVLFLMVFGQWSKNKLLDLDTKKLEL